MPAAGISRETHARILELTAAGQSQRKIAMALGIHNSTVLRYQKVKLENHPPPQPPKTDKAVESNEQTGDEWTISLPRTRIHTLDQLVAHCEIDLEIWTVERFVCNKWEIGVKVGEPKDARVEVEELFQVKAFLKKNKLVVFALDQIEILRKRAASYAPVFPFIKKRGTQTGNVAEFGLRDHHFGGLIWGQETGWEDWDTKQARDCWDAAFQTMIPRVSGYQPEKALLILGNDQQNIDNRAGSTENLTPQQNDSRYQKVFAASRDASTFAIDLLVGEYGNVEVIIVPGNHDPLACFHLGDYLSAWYSRSKQVRIENGPQFRKYWEHGVNMIMFEHGHKSKPEKYGETMAAERPEMWGRTKVREAHTAHVHHRDVFEGKGFTARTSPSLRPSCAWGSEHHHVGAERRAETLVWNRDEGLVGTAAFSILKPSEVRP